MILKKIPVKEYDEILICYTEESGKQLYQAKSILRPTSKQASHLNILSLVDFSLVHKNSNPIITSAYCLESFYNMKSSLKAMSAAFFLLECFDKLVFEGEADLKLWNFLTDRLYLYNKLAEDRNTDWAEVIGATRRGILQILGYDLSQSLEQLANSRFNSLQFAHKVLK